MDFHNNDDDHNNALRLLCCDEIIDSSLWSSSSYAQLPPRIHTLMYPPLHCFAPCHPNSTILSSFSHALLSLDDHGDALTFDNLLHQESAYLPAHHYLPKLRIHQMLSQRLVAVRWLIKACKIFGFCPLTAVLAVNYLDRYLAHNMSPTWKPWMFELLSVACLSVAAKMEEVDVPALIDLQVDGLGHLFDGATVQRMELAVMNGLNWKLRSVTPIAFADKAIGCLPLSYEAKHLLSERVSELIIGTLLEVEFLEFPASVIAAACVQFALLENFPVQTDAGSTEWLINQIGSSKTEEVKKCSKMVEELVADPAEMPAAVETEATEAESEEGYGGAEGKSPPSPTGVLAVAESEIMAAEVFGRGMRKRMATSGSGDVEAKRWRRGGGVAVGR